MVTTDRKKTNNFIIQRSMDLLSHYTLDSKLTLLVFSPDYIT